MKTSPPYKPPSDDKITARVPRLVNARWLQQALRANARASRAGNGLPWNDVDLYTRTATLIEQLVVRGVL